MFKYALFFALISNYACAKKTNIDPDLTGSGPVTQFSSNVEPKKDFSDIEKKDTGCTTKKEEVKEFKVEKPVLLQGGNTGCTTDKK